MKYIDEYRNRELVQSVIKKIEKVSSKNISLMEVCGGHTLSIQKFGIPSLLPGNIKLLSGPGCPVCVTGRRFIDQAVALGRMDGTIICTYGDLIRVPGSESSLMIEKASGRDVRIVFSSLEAIEVAKENKGKNIVFLGIGFETTAPGSAVAVLNADKEGIDNFFLLSSHKIMPPAMAALIDEGVRIDGYICPGHVSTITGSVIYDDIVKKSGKACVIAGFEPLDILHAIYLLVKQVEQNEPKVEIAYKRAVTRDGNLLAKKMMDEVFELKADWWRGFGMIPESGLVLREKYLKFDAEKAFNISVPEPKEEKGCICGEILKGLKTPHDCRLFAGACTPVNPVGACMVSSEGSCATYYRYNR